MDEQTMKGHGGREISRHAAYECICWKLRASPFCMCECHALEDAPVADWESIYGSDDHARAALSPEDYEHFTGSSRDALLEEVAQEVVRRAREAADAQREHDIAEGIASTGTSTVNEVEWHQMGNWAATVIRAMKSYTVPQTVPVLNLQGVQNMADITWNESKLLGDARFLAADYRRIAALKDANPDLHFGTPAELRNDAALIEALIRAMKTTPEQAEGDDR